MQQTTADVLIVGSGIAGLYTALHLAGARRVLLVTAGPLEAGNTPLAQGGIAAALGPDDSPELHYADTLAAGAGHCDPSAVRTLVEEGPECVEDLWRRGIPFARAAGAGAGGAGATGATAESTEAAAAGLSGTAATVSGWALTREAAHSRRRVAFVADHTGLAVHQGLARALLADDRIAVRTGHRLVQLLTDGGRCTGALLQGPRGEWVAVRAGFTVLATGGCGSLYRLTTNSRATGGDGMVIAYEAGAALADLEFIQFHPTALWHRGAAVALVTEALRGEGAVLRNAAGDRFMPAIDERAELAPRDVVARAVFRQMELDNAPHVLLDARHLGPAVRERFPSVTAACAAIGVDPATDLIPVVPAAHYSMGGIVTDGNGLTTLPGLLAVGETACTGVHGANRLASNSLLEGLVFGRRAARWLAEAPVQPLAAPAARHVRSAVRDVGAVKAEAPESSGSPATPDADQTVAEVMWSGAGLVRSGDGLLRAEQALAQLTAPRSSPLGRRLTLARLIVAAARQRTESRGAHFRADCPGAAPSWAGRRIFHRIDSHREVTA